MFSVSGSMSANNIDGHLQKKMTIFAVYTHSCTISST